MANWKVTRQSRTRMQIVSLWPGLYIVTPNEANAEALTRNYSRIHSYSSRFIYDIEILSSHHTNYDIQRDTVNLRRVSWIKYILCYAKNIFNSFVDQIFENMNVTTKTKLQGLKTYNIFNTSLRMWRSLDRNIDAVEMWFYEETWAYRGHIRKRKSYKNGRRR